jgi:hypothetical protein
MTDCRMNLSLDSGNGFLMKPQLCSLLPVFRAGDFTHCNTSLLEYTQNSRVPEK